MGSVIIIMGRAFIMLFIIKSIYGKCQSPTCTKLFVTPWTVARQASLSMGFSRQEYWSGLPFPFSGNLPNSQIKPRSPALQADSLPFEPPGKPIYGKPMVNRSFLQIDYDKVKMHIVISRPNTKSSTKGEKKKTIFLTNGAGKKCVSCGKIMTFNSHLNP